MTRLVCRRAAAATSGCFHVEAPTALENLAQFVQSGAPSFWIGDTNLLINLIVGIVHPGVRFFHTGVRRRKYKLGQTKQNPSDRIGRGSLAPGVGSFGYGAMRFKSSRSAGSFKMKRFEIFCSDPFTHQPGEWHLTSRCGSSFGFVL